MYAIELDCGPQNRRSPAELLPEVIEGLRISLDPVRPDSALCGTWVWNIPEEQIQQYLRIRTVIESRINSLHSLGEIRGGGW